MGLGRKLGGASDVLWDFWCSDLFFGPFGRGCFLEEGRGVRKEGET